MSALTQTDELFFKQTGMDPSKVKKIVTTGLQAADGGELFLEHFNAEGFVWEKGRLAGNSFSVREGFGLRYIAGPAFAYASNNELSEQAIQNAAATVSALKTGGSGGTLSLNTRSRRM